MHLAINRRIAALAAAFLTLAGIGSYALFGGSDGAVAVMVNGQRICVAEDQAQAEDLLKDLTAQESKRIGQPVCIKGTLGFEALNDENTKVDSEAAMEAAFKQVLQLSTKGAAIQVDGKPVAYLATATQAKAILAEVKKRCMVVADGETLKTVRFERPVKVVSANVPAGKLLSTKEALSLLTTGVKCPVVYTVRSGDNLWMIARRHDMHVREIHAANPDMPKRLRVGQKLVLTVNRPPVAVETVVVGDKKQAIPFTTRVVYDASLRSGVKEKQAGQEGEKQVQYVLTKRNGVVVENKTISERVLKKPVDQIIARTRSGQPVMVASRGLTSMIGGYIWPTIAGISSPFGGGRHHTGVDIDGDSGDPIRAAKSGTVTYASRYKAYGNLITIDHGDGTQTRYAHCSKILVEVGQKVKQGELIGNVGSTGRSTGSHLHFEVVQNGIFCNPMKVLR
ncbi:MAG: peptidoglycan DD-metalloendopeptidase family protein [Solirubrobacterales bacterium]